MVALVATLAVVSITSSLTWPILSEGLRNQGYSESMIGINAGAQFVGIILIALAAPRIFPGYRVFQNHCTRPGGGRDNVNCVTRLSRFRDLAVDSICAGYG
ncbi:MAG: hypothetical protein Ct9H300mP13_1740 [Gammaproteobacteria bacterium]|nr:MAG: hypothetical protein Ct9H300mP13_1740 [Gammaproteobacteria bacterium]